MLKEPGKLGCNIKVYGRLNTVEHTFNKIHLVVTSDTKSLVLINGDQIQIDPQLLFQRLVIVVQPSKRWKLVY